MFYLPEKIQFPESLGDLIQNRLVSSGSITNAHKNLGQLWKILAFDHGVQEKHYSFDRKLAEAYASYYLPVNALKPALILEEAWQLGLDLLPDESSTWLDFGCGPGTAFFGLTWWAQARKKKFRYFGLEQSNTFADLADRLISGLPGSNPVAVGDLSDWRILESSLLKIKPTHVSFINSWKEIFSKGESQSEIVTQILKILLRFSKADGKQRYLMLVEPGTMAHSRALSEMKDQIEKFSPLLPCLDQRKCGALAISTDWCHQSVECEFPEWLNALGAQAELRKEAILFSYLLIPVLPQSLPVANGWRMVSQRLERKGQMECFLCTQSGKKKLRVQHSKRNETNEFFCQIRKGDILPTVEFLEKGDVIGGRKIQPLHESIF